MSQKITVKYLQKTITLLSTELRTEQKTSQGTEAVSARGLVQAGGFQWESQTYFVTAATV